MTENDPYSRPAALHFILDTFRSIELEKSARHIDRANQYTGRTPNCYSVYRRTPFSAFWRFLVKQGEEAHSRLHDTTELDGKSTRVFLSIGRIRSLSSGCSFHSSRLPRVGSKCASSSFTCCISSLDIRAELLRFWLIDPVLKCRCIRFGKHIIQLSHNGRAPKQASQHRLYFSRDGYSYQSPRYDVPPIIRRLCMMRSSRIHYYTRCLGKWLKFHSAGKMHTSSLGCLARDDSLVRVGTERFLGQLHRFNSKCYISTPLFGKLSLRWMRVGGSP